MDDPSVVRSVAVHTDDIVSAYEAARGGRPAVIRMTPPFAPRMRGRLHLADVHDDPDAVHIPPERFLAADAPALPTADETRAELREQEGAAPTDRHHEYHTERVRAWRAAVRDHLAARVTVETPDGPLDIAVKHLG